LALAALALSAATAHAEHFEYTVALQGIYSGGGSEGCFPPDFNQPACPRPGYLSALLSFDTPGTADGAYLIAQNFGDITNFTVNLGWLPSEALYGGVNLSNGVPNGTVQSADATETFTFDWSAHTATYQYDYGYHASNGSFSGAMYAVPEPSLAVLMLAGLAAVAGIGRRRRAGTAATR
jgi:hypothetical protein